MSTNASVGVMYEDGTIDTIYVHSDGYLAHTGKMLVEHYNDPMKAEALINLGDLSIIGEVIGEQQDFSKWDRVSCLAYHRDRGERWADVEPVRYENEEEYLYDGDPMNYNYLFKDGVWLYSRNADKMFEPVEAY